MLDEKFIFLALLFNVIGNLGYLRAVIQGKAKPHKVSWFLWALAPLIGFAAQLSEGVGLISLMTLAVGLGPGVIFLASFMNKKADWKINNFDIFCGSISVLALILWAITQDAILALTLSIIADAVACIPSLIKSWYFPETEEPNAYLFAAISALITTLTIHTWNFETFGFPLWILLIASIFYILIRFKIGKKIKLTLT